MARIKRFYGSILWKEDNRMMTIRINLKSTKRIFWCHVIMINKYMLLMDFCMLQKLLMPKYQIMFSPFCHQANDNNMKRCLQNYLIAIQALKLNYDICPHDCVL